MDKLNYDSIIQLKKVNKSFPGIHAVKDVDFQLKKGEIHCLVGSNGSGKSTLIKIISGVETPDPGSQLFIKGREVRHHNSSNALREGIQVIYQDLALFPNLSVQENIAFHRHCSPRQFRADWKNVAHIAEEAMKKTGLTLDSHRLVSEFSIAQKQLIEITRCISAPLSLLILDEPTSSLTRKEVNTLFSVILSLKEKGIAILFVSHKLNEIFEIAETVTIIRDGSMVGSYAPEKLDHSKLIYLMTGHREEHKKLHFLPRSDVPLLSVQNLSKRRNYKDISFTLQRGEILGITGLLGSGRTELALTLFGMNPPDSGQVLLEGTPLALFSNMLVMSRGIGLVPENRREEGLIYDQSILDNLSLCSLNKFLNKLGILNKKQLDAAAEQWAKKLGIKVPRFELPVQTLSGGNQQKVVLAKWLSITPKLLLLDEPTVGIDVIAKSSIHGMMKELAAQGMGIIVISDEVSEVLYNCHRILVMDRGRVAGEFAADEIDETSLLKDYNLA